MIGNAQDRPPFTGPAPALLGFDETIVEECSRLLGLDAWEDHQDLNFKLAHRCVEANRNVLRIMSGPKWDLCQNMQWEMCGVLGKLPGQDGGRDGPALQPRLLTFGTAPKDLNPKWFLDPTKHPTYPCHGSWCDPNGYTVGDVFFVEVCILFAVCMNREELFTVDVGDGFVCDFDPAGYTRLSKVLRGVVR